MQENLTYEINSEVSKDNCENHLKGGKYEISWDSPKGRLVNNIIKIDDELLSIRDKIKHAKSSLNTLQSGYSLQNRSCKHQDCNCSHQYKCCEFVMEVNHKEEIIAKMLNDMKIIENQRNAINDDNIRLTRQLESETCLRMKLEQELQYLLGKANMFNELDQENIRLREENKRMRIMLEEASRAKYFDMNQYCYHHYQKDYNSGIHAANQWYQPNDEDRTTSTFILQQTNSDLNTTNKGNESYNYQESLYSDVKALAHYESSSHNNDIIHNRNCLHNPYGRDYNDRDNITNNSDNLQNIHNSHKDDSYTSFEEHGYNKVVFPHKLRNSKSTESISKMKKGIMILESKSKDDFENSNKANNSLIRIEDNMEQTTDENRVERKSSNPDAKHRFNNLKNQITQIQIDQPPFVSKIFKAKTQNPTNSEVSIDETNNTNEHIANTRTSNSKCSSKGQINQSSYTKDEFRTDIHRINTNLETVSTENQNHLLSSNKYQISSLLEKINQLTDQLNQYKYSLSKTQKELEVIQKENKLLKQKLKRENNKVTSFLITDNQSPLLHQSNFQLCIMPGTSFFNQPVIYDQYYEQEPNTSTKKGNLFSKLKINTSMTIEDTLLKSKLERSNNLLFKPYDKKRLLCFDITNHHISLIEFIDYSDYDVAFTNGSLIYLNHKDGLYIITGQNSDCLYSYTQTNNTLNKLSNLSNNHAHGGLVSYRKYSTNEISLVCLSGWYNKKVEEFTSKSNEWSSLPEMPIERSESSFLVSNNKIIYAFLGYNCPQKRYLNTIDYCYINSTRDQTFKWRAIKYTYEQEPFSLYLKSHSVVSVNPNNFVIIGGFDGKDDHPVDCFIQIKLTNQINDVVVSQVDRKLHNIEKNHLYNFSCDFGPLFNEKGVKYQVCFDKEERAHVINTEKMTHDIFYLD